ncbi:glycosyl hydrolase family 28-related protein [Devosia sp. Root105]|uniref:glycosyl hydrolase family 28-related protein n=1 Tax=Devosia sp. Root105 TaxID=1736423 RepID=UPI0006F4962B|nr:glycosyl hydrolase family 28-related protein [Devosia sp. Root105]KQU96428.1 hypothetical protein ASC68_13700 [Devosia sp. Root105]
MTIPDIGVSPIDHGACGDGIADDKAALDAAFSAATACGAPLFLPGGKRFKAVLSEPWVWDFDPVKYDGLKITGQGKRQSIIQLAPTFSGGPGVKAWQWRASSDWYYLDASDFCVETTFDGVALTIGHDDFRDPMNFFTARNLMVFNPKVGWNTEALRLNYLVNGHLDNCQANCFANGQGANYGTALHHRQARFVLHSNPSYGNASHAVLFDGGFNVDIEFDVGDYENANYLWCVNSATSGNIRVRGGQHSLWQMHGVYAPQSMAKAIVFESPNIANAAGLPAVFSHPSNGSRVRIKDLWA